MNPILLEFVLKINYNKSMSNLYSNSIFWIDTDKIKPNPLQPRRDFDEDRLQDLAPSIKQYGVLQPLTVSRLEVEKGDGGIVTEYELIAGERRLRAAKMAGVSQVPVIIRTGDTAMAKLELSIIENLQREDLNAVDRARAFSRLYNEFKFTHGEIAKKIGRSREYVTNSIRILGLPEEVLEALSLGKISEGHTRPILMLADQLEEAFGERLGTRVQIDRRELGGQIKIDFLSVDDLREILTLIGKSGAKKPTDMLENYISENSIQNEVPLDDRSREEVKDNERGLYDISNFSV